jgi:hypothetical protein
MNAVIDGGALLAQQLTVLQTVRLVWTRLFGA